MCFYIRNNKKSATLYVAKEDIACYKILESNLISPYRAYKYKFNKLVKAKLKIPKSLNKNGEYQFNLISYYRINERLLSIEKGLHSYVNYSTALKNKNCRLFQDTKIYKCIIPKGSEFYYDPVQKEYVSNQLIVKNCGK